MLKQPFEVPFSEVQADPAPYIEAVLGSLASEFWVMPKGNGFVDYPTFDSGYERLKQSTKGFREHQARVRPPSSDRLPDFFGRAAFDARFHTAGVGIHNRAAEGS